MGFNSAFKGLNKYLQTQIMAPQFGAKYHWFKTTIIFLTNTNFVGGLIKFLHLHSNENYICHLHFLDLLTTNTQI